MIKAMEQNNLRGEMVPALHVYTLAGDLERLLKERVLLRAAARLPSASSGRS